MSTSGVLRCGAALTLALWLMSGCSGNPVACADLFRGFFITVVDTTGSPVTDARVTSILTRTGDTLSSFSGPAPNGIYRIASSGDAGKFRRFDTMRVTAEHPSGAQARATYSVVVGDCGIDQVSGPDTLTLR